MFVIMIGALHIEMANMSATGARLEDSGWTVLSNAKVPTPGNQLLVSGHDVAKCASSDSLLPSSTITRSILQHH